MFRSFVVVVVHTGGVCGGVCSEAAWARRRTARCNAVGVVCDADNELGEEGMATLAPALGKLVSLTSLDLGCTYAPSL